MSSTAVVRLRLHRWNDATLFAVALVALASGFGQFGVVAALGNVARTFGHVSHGSSVADQAGLSGTELGIGLAVIRLASLGGLPIAGAADRFGRRRLVLAAVTLGLALTVIAAGSPNYWWFVVVFACGRPLLSATNALTQVIAAEETGASDRAKAVALVAAGYGVGAGLIAILHGLFLHSLGFRGLFALAAVPLLLVQFVRRRVPETERFRLEHDSESHKTLALVAAARNNLRRFGIVVLISFAISVITGPANTFVFLFAQSFAHLSGSATALMVVGAGVAGLAGLLLGRLLADRLGRRLTAAAGMVAVAVCGAVAYSGGRWALIGGYVLGVLAGAVLAPPLGSMVNELFPTAVRASVAGWVTAAGVLGAVAGLLVFGTVADVGNRFSFSADVVFLPAAAFAGLFMLLPETRGREPEDLTATGHPAPLS